jgi:hypothetical protein
MNPNEEQSMLSQESLGLLRTIEPHHHERIEQLLDRLAHESYGDDPRALCDAWAQLDRALEAHFRDEEAYVLPAFADANPGEARALLAEHAAIRRLAAELGVDVELHAIRADTIGQLRQRLRAHAEREDAIMYPWATGHLV